MPDPQILARLREGSLNWNYWREQQPESERRDWPALQGADLRGIDLKYFNLEGADLTEADLSGANLRGARLCDVDFGKATLKKTRIIDADVVGANFSQADCRGASLAGSNCAMCDFTGANLERASLEHTNLFRCNLHGTNLRQAYLEGTIFGFVNLGSARNLHSCEHAGPSVIDFETLQISGHLPITFLRGLGLPDIYIDYLPSLLDQPIQHYSCFISYSSLDQKFADRLHADLQSRGIRCWFAPHDLPIGARTWDAIDEAIRLRDKLLLILSDNSIKSDWVNDEVNKAFAEERRRSELVLVPIRIDDAIMKTEEAWASKLRDQRNIGDFTGWKRHERYEKSLIRLLRDLKHTTADEC